METRLTLLNLSSIVALVVLSSLLLIVSANAQSTDRDHPTPITTSVVRAALNGDNREYFYTLTAGAGELVATFEVKAASYNAGIIVDIFDENDGQLVPQTLLQAINQGSDRVTKRLELGKKQTIVVRVKSLAYGSNSSYPGTLLMRFSGAFAADSSNANAANAPSNSATAISTGEINTQNAAPQRPNEGSTIGKPIGETSKPIAGLENIKTRPGEKRVALVIGNAAYKDAPLRNPLNDARDMATRLRELGFDVTARENLMKRDMENEIRVFGKKIRGGGVGLFYFSGHGVQVRGNNYLLPLGYNIEKEQDVEYEAVDAGRVLAEMEAAQNRLNILILDACRNNPLMRSFRSADRGLAIINAPSGTFVAYSTAPGSVASDGDGRNGLFTEELLNAMRVPGLKIEEVFKRVRGAVRDRSNGKQIPYDSSAIDGDFYFLEDALTKRKPAPEK